MCWDGRFDFVWTAFVCMQYGRTLETKNEEKWRSCYNGRCRIKSELDLRQIRLIGNKYDGKAIHICSKIRLEGP